MSSILLVAHKIYGIPQTINTANYVYFLAYQELFSLRPRSRPESDTPSETRAGIMLAIWTVWLGLKSDLYRWRDQVRYRALSYCHWSVRLSLIVYSLRWPTDAHVLLILDELLSLHRGQGLELLWRDSLQCPTEEEYISMVNNSERPYDSMSVYSFMIPETGGLLRIAIKLMMTCATTNTNV
jgi:geranylgeranyl diphosphate synthase, type III